MMQRNQIRLCLDIMIKGQNMQRELQSKTFSYIKYDETSMQLSEEAKGLCEKLERLIHTLGAGRAQSLALTNLEVTYAWIGKAIRDVQLLREPQAPHVAERTAE